MNSKFTGLLTGSRRGTVRPPENIVEREVKEQLSRETELVAMYASRSYDHRASAYTSPSPTSGPCVTDGSPPVRRRLGDVEGRRQAQSVTHRRRPGEDCASDDRTCDDQQSRRYSSPGEEIVYREMMEQQARESELRRHWKQTYGVYIAPLSIDDMHLVSTPEPEINTSERQLDMHNGGLTDSCTTHVPTRTVNGNRNVKWRADENEAGMTSAERGGASGGRRAVSRSMSARLPARPGNVTRQDKATNHQRQAAADDNDETLKRRSRNEADLRIENEVIEAIRREQELRQLRESLKHLNINTDNLTSSSDS